MTLLTDATAWHSIGVCIVPTATDGTKRPGLPTWRQYETQHPTDNDITTWFTTPGFTDGFGAICGAISGNLEMFEFEGRATHLVSALAATFADNDLTELWQRLTVGGYVETTPSGGIHILYRVTDGPAARNTKLARRPATTEELEINPHEKLKVLIETRGEGGFTVLAPSTGRTHPTGKPWVTVVGTPHTIANITVDERDLLFALASTFDEVPEPEQFDHTSPRTTAPSDGSLRPGDDFNQRATWDDILTPHGWTKTKRLGSGYGWTRPGKNARDGISATTGQNEHDRLYVFSSSTAFDTERPYSKFAAYAHLEHDGDYAAAAKHLATDGYGTIATRLTDNILNGLPASPTAATTPTVDTHTNTPSRAREATPNEDNTALLLVDQHQHEIRYCPGRGSWLIWNGHRWVNDDRGHVRELVRTITRRLPEGEGWASYKKRAQSNNGVNGILGLAQTDPRIVAPVELLDARPYELNTPAGVVNLRTGTLTQPEPTALHTRSTTVAPDLNMPRPMWDKFLADTFAGDPDETAYIQRLLGLSLVGVVLEQIFAFAHGAGANGKTTLLSVAQRVAGTGPTGYAMSAPATMLLATRNDSHPTELARLSGARLVVTSELEDNQRFAEAKIKLLTGKDTISGRFMRQDWFDFTPTHTLWLLANHQPEVRAGGEAFWRRVRMIPFLHTVPPESRIPDLEDQLIEKEGPAILAWMIEGAAAYFAHGLAEPASVTKATDAYRRDQDPIARFIDERCELGNLADPNMSVPSHELRNAYVAWCTQEGEEPLTQKAMTMTLRNRFNVLPTRTNTLRLLKGIRLDSETDDTAPQQSSTLEDFDPTDRGGW